MQTETISGTARGRNQTVPLCHPDTNVWVDAFLENPTKMQAGPERTRVLQAQEFFVEYDGDHLFTSPMVLAEFFHVATSPTKSYRLTEQQARDRIQQIFEKERFELSVPKVGLHTAPQLKLPLLDYSLRLNGSSNVNGRAATAGLIFRQGAIVRFGNAGGLPLLSTDEIHANAKWDEVILSSAIYDMLIEAAKNGTSSTGGPLQFQDAFVLQFARGHGYVEFMTSDMPLIQRAGRKPFPDVGVISLADFNATLLRRNGGKYRN